MRTPHETGWGRTATVRPMYSVRRLKRDEWARWDRFVASAPNGTLYHTSYWLEQAGRLCGTTPAIWGIYKGSTLVGGCVFQEEAGDTPSGILGPCCQYNGFIMDNHRTIKPYRHERALHGAVSALTRELARKYRSVTLVNTPYLRDVRPFLWSGWDVRPCYTYVWETGEPEDLLPSMHNDARRQIRLAEGKVKVEKCHGWQEVLRLWRLSFHRKGLKVRLEEEDLGRCYGALARRDMVETFLARSDAGYVAGLTILKHKEGIYLWFNGLDPAYRSSGSHTFLLWHVMNLYRTSTPFLDLCGGDIPEVAAYKAALGAALTPHYSCTLRGRE